MDASKIKYRHLFAWDCMMLSYEYWKQMMQEHAAAENAPLDAVYRKSDMDGNAKWVTFREVTNPVTRLQIARFFEDRGWGDPAA